MRDAPDSSPLAIEQDPPREPLTHGRLELVMENGRTFGLPYVTVAALATSISLDSVPLTVLGIWCGIYASFVTYRTLVTRTYFKRAPAKRMREHRLWWRLSNASGVIHGLTWALYSVWLFPMLSYTEQVAIYATLLIQAALGSVFAAATRFGLQAYLLIAVGSMAFAWAFFGKAHPFFYATGSIAALYLLLRASEQQARLVSRTLRLAERNDALAREVIQRNRQLHATNTEKSQLIAAASHDLRQPVHALGILTHRLDPDLKRADLLQLFRVINSRVSLLSELLGSLLDLSKLDNDAYQPNLQPTALQHLLDEVAEAFMEQATRKSLRLTTQCAPVSVRTDPLLLRRVLYNLVSNAVKYTETGYVQLDAALHGDALRIRVRDSGSGIPQNRLSDIFMEYYRLHQHRDMSEGLGIGLSVVERIVRLLGYGVHVRSEIGHGSEFTVIVPLEWVDVCAPELERVSDTAPLPTPAMEPGRIFIIENDESTLAGMVALLRDWGHEVTPATDGTAALQLLGALKERRPQLLISDLHLGTMDGLDCIRQARELLDEPLLPAILLTGDLTSTPQTAADHRVTLVYKPLRPVELRNIIRDHLRREIS